MVQAGSGLKPQSISEAQADLARARQALLEAQLAHDDAQKRLELELAHAEEVTKSELIETVKEELEAAHEVVEARGEMREVLSKFQQIVKSFQSGGLAGVIARSSVAPMDRIKIIQQTSGAIEGSRHICFLCCLLHSLLCPE